MKSILLALTFIALMVPAPKSMALGQTEEGILYGLGIYKIFDIITEEDPWEPGQNRTYGSEFPPFSCKGSGIDCAYQRGVYESETEEWEDSREKDYDLSLIHF